MVCDIQLPMDSKILDNVKFFGFFNMINFFQAVQCVQVVTSSYVKSNPSGLHCESFIS